MEGVVRAPSLFSSTVALPPSRTAMQEFVVPRSMPRILLIGFGGGKLEWKGFGVLPLARDVPSGVGSAGGLDSTRFQRFGSKVPLATKTAKVPGFGTVELALGTVGRMPFSFFGLGRRSLGSALSERLKAARQTRVLQLCEKIHNLFAAPSHGAYFSRLSHPTSHGRPC
jgi:hypothetical protein